MRQINQMIRNAHSLMLRFLLAGSDTLHPRSKSMPRSDLFLWTRSHGIRKYAIAVLSVTTALILTRWQPLHLEMAPASLFFCAVMLVPGSADSRLDCLLRSLPVSLSITISSGGPLPCSEARGNTTPHRFCCISPRCRKLERCAEKRHRISQSRTRRSPGNSPEATGHK